MLNGTPLPIASEPLLKSTLNGEHPVELLADKIANGVAGSLDWIGGQVFQQLFC